MPKTYTAAERESICETVVAGLSKGTPLTVICSGDGMPCDDTIRAWADEDAGIARAIARARERGFDAIAVEGMRIVDDIGEDPASRRVRSDYRLKLLAKWDPKRYGDMIKHAAPDGESPAVTALAVAFVRPGEQSKAD